MHTGADYREHQLVVLAGDQLCLGLAAGFGQLLRGGKYTGSLKHDDVIREARGALGEDPFGYRAEFLTLAHKVKEAGGR